MEHGRILHSKGSFSAVALSALVLLSAPAHPDTLELPAAGGDLVGWRGEIATEETDTLADVARAFDLGHEEIRLANPGLDFWLPGANARVTLPTRFILPDAEREGLVLNVAEMRLYFFPAPPAGRSGAVVMTYPVSIGRMDWSTPLGRTRVAARVENPSWTPPDSIRQEAEARGEPLPDYLPPGPDNPLGAYALRLDLPGYLIHGTNRPYGVGMRVTHGCVRMYPEDIARLYPLVSTGTPVQIVNQPVKVGWSGDTLFIEVHPPLEEDDTGDEELTRIALQLIEDAVGPRSTDLVGREIRRAIAQKSGIPLAISRGSEM